MEKSIRKSVDKMLGTSGGAISVKVEATDKKGNVEKYENSIVTSWNRESELPFLGRITRKLLPRTYEKIMELVASKFNVSEIEAKYSKYFEAMYKNGTFERKVETEIIDNFQGTGLQATKTITCLLFKPDYEDRELSFPISEEGLYSIEDFKHAIKTELLENLRKDLRFKEVTEIIAKRLRLI